MSKKLILILLALSVLLYFCSEKKRPLNPYNMKYNPDKWKPTKLELSSVNIHSVALQWEQEEDNIDGFMVDKKIGNDDWLIAFDTINYRTKKYIDTSAVPNEEIIYNLYAFADRNKSNPLSKTITLDFPAPTNLSITQNSLSKITLNWKDNSDGEDGFQIDRKVGNDDWQQGFDFTTDSSWVDTTVTVKQTYYYQVKGIRGKYHSDKVDTSITCLFPCPTNLTIRQLSDELITLNWEDNIDGEDVFVIDRKTGDKEWVSDFAKLEENTTTWSDESPIYGVVNTYRLFAGKDNEKSSYLEIEIENIIPAPTDLSLEYDKSTITLSWTDSCNFETGFIIERQVNSGSFLQLGEVDSSTCLYKDNSIEQDTDYKYRVCAKTTQNQSDWTESFVFNTENSAPNASFTISPSEGDINTEFTFDASKSSDIEDPIDSLEVRWDFESDQIWDTEYSTTKIQTHQYSLIDTFKVTLNVKDTDGKETTVIKTVIVSNNSPQASFTITPDTGTIDTVFTFDASGCSDEEDETSDLQVRWDFENDGIWDTEYSLTKIITHQYDEVGANTVVLKVKDTDEAETTVTKTLNIVNTTPVASFTISPETGTVDTIFTFDASTCTDKEDSIDDLQVRWDFQNDGTWDTDYSTTKTATHTFSNTGDYTVKLEVIDTGEETDQISKQIKVTQNVFTEVEMVLVNGGTYTMGDTFGDGENDETPIHDVTVDNFYIGKYEITHKQYIEFLNSYGVSSNGYYDNKLLIEINDNDCAIGHNGSSFYFKGSDCASDANCPVMEVTWYGAVEYANWLSDKNELSKCYTITGNTVTCDYSANGYRLPTEAEWEYAARSGGRSDRKWSGTNTESDINDFAWYSYNSDNISHKVGGKYPNDLKIYDMSGNIREWCWDRYSSSYYSSSPSNNPTGPESGSNRVYRGGGWYYDSYDCRTVNRGSYSPSSSGYNLGFRVVRNTN